MAAYHLTVNDKECSHWMLTMKYLALHYALIESSCLLQMLNEIQN